jgi:hypothetical protein
MADGILPPVVLIAAPTGARKSTRMRTAAVAFVTAHPDQTAVIALPRHELGKEQIAMLMREHPNANIKAAIWRGRHADDPETPHPQHPGFMPMCWRSEEAEELEKALVNVESHLCKRGRGKKAIKCPFYDGRCGYQRQKLIAANIWFCAHESMVHAKPKALGDIGWLLIDESPLDAFTFGIETDDRIELALDALREPPPPGLSRSDASEGGARAPLSGSRQAHCPEQRAPRRSGLIARPGLLRGLADRRPQHRAGVEGQGRGRRQA